MEKPRFQAALVSTALVLTLAGCDGLVTTDQTTEDTKNARPEGSDGGRDGGQREGTDPRDANASSDGGKAVDSSVDGDGSLAVAQDSGVDAAPPFVGSAGCKGSGTPPEGLQTMEVNGKTRTYIVHVPESYDASTAYPLLFGFHGASRTAADFDNDKGTFRFGPALGDRTIVVYPNALKKDGGVTTWSRDTDDDLAFFDAMLTKLQTDLCVHPDRIFATGHSSGGYFSHTLGCRRGDVLRGVAPVAGGERDFKNCENGVAVWMAHGTEDNQVPVATGEKARQYWVDANGCDEATSTTTPSPCVAHTNCNAGYPVHWCEHDEPTYGSPPTHHGWPSFATAAITSFFEAL